MNYTAAIGYVCTAVVIIVGLTQCGTRTDPQEVKAVSEACAKVGKEPRVVVTTGRIELGCSSQPAASGVR